MVFPLSSSEPSATALGGLAACQGTRFSPRLRQSSSFARHGTCGHEKPRIPLSPTLASSQLTVTGAASAERRHVNTKPQPRCAINTAHSPNTDGFTSRYHPY